jgi:hypothetical protein
MIVRKKSPFTGAVAEWDLPITQAQIDRWQGGELIQAVFPDLSADQREFLMTGITPEEWRRFIGED